MSEVRVKFSVKAASVEKGALLHLVGNHRELGQWRSQQAVALHQQPLHPDNDEEKKMSVWEVTVVLPRKSTVSYRFFIGAVCMNEKLSDASDVEVMLWETNIEPRLIITPDTDEHELPLASFGSYGGEHTVSQGWLENHTCVEVRFHNNPIFMWKPKHRRQLYSVKCTPLNYESETSDDRPEEESSIFQEDSSLEGPPLCNRTAMLYYNLNREDSLKPTLQPVHGCVYNEDDYLVFISRGFNQQHLGFQIDFFVHKKDTPQYIGSAHLLPPKIDVTLYSKRVPIIGLNHRPIGEIEVETLRITPLSGYDWKMDVSYQNHWKRRHGQTPLNVGHRGMGSSYKRVANVKENTIHSLFSAAENGADFVEFDVLLTKDMVPVIYHDFSICLSTARRVGPAKDLLEVSVKDLCLNKLQSLRLFHSSASTTEVDSNVIEVTEGEVEEDFDPFPTLQRCLERVGTNLGFNIEIKYPQHIETGECEAENYFDLNVFIDRILDIILKHGADRKIVFSSFHADACILLNHKQNKYPVLFLSNGPTKRYVPYRDWRCSTFHHGICFAKSEGFLGVDLQAEGLLQDLSLISYIQSMGLVLFVWGEDLNEEPVKATLRKHGVDAIIFDRIGHAHRGSYLTECGEFDDILTSGKASHLSHSTFTVPSESEASHSEASHSSGTCVDAASVAQYNREASPMKS